MSLGDEAVEAAATVWWNETDPGPYPTDEFCREMGYPDRDNWRAILRAFLEAEGFVMDDDDGHNSMCRLIGAWREKP